VISASASYAFALLTIVPKPAATSSADDGPTRTPFASVLCRMSGETILEDDRVADLLGQRRRRHGGRRQPFLRHGDAVGVADPLGLRLRQLRPLLGAHGVQHRTDRRLVCRRGGPRLDDRCLHALVSCRTSMTLMPSSMQPS
jgi:hypothetical protein